jgi:two-component system, NarL family, sensor kinase
MICDSYISAKLGRTRLLLLLLNCIFFGHAANAQLSSLGPHLPIDSLRRLLRNNRQDTSRVIFLTELSRELSNVNTDSALLLARQALALAEHLSDKRGKARSHLLLGWCNNVRGNYQAALQHLFAGLPLAGDSNSIASSIYGVIGNVADNQQQHRKALENYQKALAIDESINNHWGITRNLGLIGFAYTALKDYKRGLQYNFRALDLSRKLHNPNGESVWLGYIGDVHNAIGTYDSAIQYYLQAYSISSSRGNQWKSAEFEHNLGDVYLSVGDYERSHYYLVKGLKRALDISSMDEAKNCYESLARLYEISDLKLPDSAGKTRLGVAGMRVQALRYHRSFVHVRDSLFGLERQRETMTLEMQQKETAAIALQEKRELVAGQKLFKERERQKLLRTILGSGLALTLLSAVFVISYYRRRQQSEKLIATERINRLLKEQELISVNSMLEAQEGERRRIAADLHDRLGSMLSTVKIYFGVVEEQMEPWKASNKDHYAMATKLLDEACEEVRRISHDLVSGELVKFGLGSALRQLATSITESGRLRIAVLEFGMQERLESSTEVNIYRIIQELINNMLRHSRATEASIQLNRVGSNLNIVVEDNGGGFDLAPARAKGGMGLRNIETRLNKISGRLHIDAVKGRGTTTIMDISV